MFSIANRQPAVKLLNMALTEPFEAAVVTAPHSTLFVIPRRISLPSIVEANPVSVGLGVYSLANIPASDKTNTIDMAAKITQPWRCEPTSAYRCSPMQPELAGSPRFPGNYSAA
jgi:hypothetical protein